MLLAVVVANTAFGSEGYGSGSDGFPNSDEGVLYPSSSDEGMSSPGFHLSLVGLSEAERIMTDRELVSLIRVYTEGKNQALIISSR